MKLPSPLRELVLDAAAAALLPVALFAIPLNAVVFANVRELPYHAPLMVAFAVAGVVAWLAGTWMIRRFPQSIFARIWLAAAWIVLLLDVIGTEVGRQSPGLKLMLLADVLTIGVVLTAAAWVPWLSLRKAASAVGGALCLQAMFAHGSFVRTLPADPAAIVAVGDREPAPDAPGNVYHLLLDNYLSESFFDIVGNDPGRRYPGFTFYSRFNTNFPRTSSSEPALLHGRLPEPGLSVDNWPMRALDQGFWRDLERTGVGLWLYPYGRWLCPDYAVKCLASTDIEKAAARGVTRDATIDLWALRILPTSLRHIISARLSAGRPAGETRLLSVTQALRSLAPAAADNTREAMVLSPSPTQYFNLRQFDALLADEPRRPPRGQYVYYHGLIPHPYYILNERCELVGIRPDASESYWAFARCANLMIERLVNVLDDLGRLDDALIIVHSDHGDMDFLANAGAFGRNVEFALDPVARGYQRPDRTYEDPSMMQTLQDGDSAAWRSIAVEVFSSGLLLVKPPHATGYAHDTRPVQLLDVAPTVVAHFGRSTASYPGLPFSMVPAGREAVFFAHSRRFDGKLSEYRLTPEGWRFRADVRVTP